MRTPRLTRSLWRWEWRDGGDLRQIGIICDDFIWRYFSIPKNTRAIWLVVSTEKPSDNEYLTAMYREVKAWDGVQPNYRLRGGQGDRMYRGLYLRLKRSRIPENTWVYVWVEYEEQGDD